LEGKGGNSVQGVQASKRRFGGTDVSGLVRGLLPRWSLSFAVGFLLAIPTCSQQLPSDLGDKTIEDLMNIQVTSVSKTEEALSRTAASIVVITQEDISRSSALNIPDLIRVVPGVDVAQINSSTWAVSARGFNARFSNELLVLVDGRPAYTQTTGGVFWDVLDLPLEDIERIEVIRGPGGAVWGANAVNGVINIITKKAADTHGALVVAGGGNVNQGFGTIQYGGGLGKKMDYRVYAKYLGDGHFPGLTGGDGGDGWHLLQGGFRADSAPSSRDTLSFEGNLYTGREGTPGFDFPSITAPIVEENELFVNVGGGSIQFNWDHSFSPYSETTLESSYDTYERNDALGESHKMFNLDFQHHFTGLRRQSIVWGLNYRYSVSDTVGGLTASLDPSNLTTQLFGLFIQDEIAITPDRLFLTLGAKLEHNYYTGFGLLPSVRAAWVPSPRSTLWAAISKTDRTPSSLDASLQANVGGFTGPGGLPVVVRITGNRYVQDERAITYEAGYRMTVLKQLSIDVSTYFNNYTHQNTTEPGAFFLENSPTPPHLVEPLIEENLMHGETHGVEVAVKWQPTHRWTLSPGYAFEEVRMHLDPSSKDTTSVADAEGSSPGHSAQLRSHLLLCHGFAWDTSVYFVGRLTDPVEASYTRLDSQLSWRFAEHASVSFVGQNLAKARHQEFVDSTGSARTTEIKRSAYVKLTWQF
jgi:iron complex outermembrane recepter protein